MAVPTRILVVFLGVIALAVVVVPCDLSRRNHSLPVSLRIVEAHQAPEQGQVFRVRFRNETRRMLAFPQPLDPRSRCTPTPAPYCIFVAWQSQNTRPYVFPGVFAKTEHNRRVLAGTRPLIVYPRSFEDVDIACPSPDQMPVLTVKKCVYGNPDWDDRGEYRFGENGLFFGKIEASY